MDRAAPPGGFLCKDLDVGERGLGGQSDPLVLLRRPLGGPLAAGGSFISHGTVRRAGLGVREEAVGAGGRQHKHVNAIVHPRWGGEGGQPSRVARTGGGSSWCPAAAPQLVVSPTTSCRKPTSASARFRWRSARGSWACPPPRRCPSLKQFVHLGHAYDSPGWFSCCSARGRAVQPDVREQRALWSN